MDFDHTDNVLYWARDEIFQDRFEDDG